MGIEVGIVVGNYDGYAKIGGVVYSTPTDNLMSAAQIQRIDIENAAALLKGSNINSFSHTHPAGFTLGSPPYASDADKEFIYNVGREAGMLKGEGNGMIGGTFRTIPYESKLLPTSASMCWMYQEGRKLYNQRMNPTLNGGG